MDSRRKALLAAEAAETKLAEGVVVLDIQEHTPIADFFVIASGTNRVHIKAITEAVEERLEAEGVRVEHTEGQEDAGWVLLDYGDVVVHIFHPREREYYKLEYLWGDAVVLER